MKKAARSSKSKAPVAEMSQTGEKLWLRWVVLGVALAWLLSGLLPPGNSTAFDLAAFGRLPVLEGGRIKPIDTVARTSLLLISGRQTARADGRELTATEWLATALFRPGEAGRYRVFTIDDPDVLGTLGIQQGSERRFPWAALEPHTADIEKQAMQAERVRPQSRSRFQSAILDLQNRVILYQKLQNTLQVAGSEQVESMLQDFDSRIAPTLKTRAAGKKPSAELLKPLAHHLEHFQFLDQVSHFRPIPPVDPWKGDRWLTTGAASLLRLERETFPGGVIAYASMGDAWRASDPSVFNRSLFEFQSWVANAYPRASRSAKAEFIFNHFEPFYRALSLYLVVFLLACISWLGGRRALAASANDLLMVAWVIQTAGLIARMMIQGRPPVTNLYSSAVFVGWVAVALGMVLERLYRNGIGTLVSSTIGFVTLIIAHHLAASGDTLEMMRAVLDSNFWLATHVVCITVGYGATFLAGFLSTLYIVRQRFEKGFSETMADSLERMVFGVVCFATFFSFLGTILGGIWADQSWGRFWGWDPKENGALMIVLWNTFILHARVGRFVGRRGTMLMAVFGNVVTAFSWFGVNMLGIGLHSYGFMEKAFVWLVIFSISQLLLMALAVKPSGPPSSSLPQ